MVEFLVHAAMRLRWRNGGRRPDEGSQAQAHRSHKRFAFARAQGLRIRIERAGAVGFAKPQIKKEAQHQVSR